MFQEAPTDAEAFIFEGRVNHHHETEAPQAAWTPLSQTPSTLSCTYALPLTISSRPCASSSPSTGSLTRPLMHMHAPVRVKGTSGRRSSAPARPLAATPAHVSTGQDAHCSHGRTNRQASGTRTAAFLHCSPPAGIGRSAGGQRCSAERANVHTSSAGDASEGAAALRHAPSGCQQRSCIDDRTALTATTWTHAANASQAVLF